MHVVLLGDLLGTKSLLASDRDALAERSREADRAFADTFAEFHQRSRSLQALAFSDSYICVWMDHVEGERIAPVYALRFYQACMKRGLPIRIFYEQDVDIESPDDRLTRFQHLGERIARFTPISIAVWGVFAAEAAHFSPGLYIGSNLRRSPFATDVQSSVVACAVGSFGFHRVST